MPRPLRTRPAPAVRRTLWYRVHEVSGPLAASSAPIGLHVHGATTDGTVVDTAVGPRVQPVVPAGGTGDFGAYLSAFPAGQWRSAVGTRTVRLTVRVDAGALLTVHRSDVRGRAREVGQRLLAPGSEEAVDVPLGAPGEDGLLWFDLQAGPAPVRLLDAGWSVPEVPRPGGLVLGTPTIGRTVDVAANLARVAAAPALVAALARVVVVDHAPAPVAPVLASTCPAPLRALLTVVRQPNLGGSGGYARIMHEASAVEGAEAVLLLDDDVVVDPAALLRAFELARRTRASDIVGLQMLDAAAPGVLEAGAERIDRRAFWWAPADAALPGADVAAAPVRDLPALHACRSAHYAGWWGTIVPLDVVRAVGYAMPLFLKWDDVEYALRARDAGYRTLSLQGAAIWHESWRSKDDARTWPAYFHARNRVVTALLHGGPGVRTGLLLSTLAHEVKQLLALQVFAVERRQDGLAAVLAGPEALHRSGPRDVERLLGLAGAEPGQRRIALDVGAAVPASGRTAPRRVPTGGRLLPWTAVLLLRHLLAPARGRAARLPAGRGTWWELPWYDDVLAPTADGGGYFRLVRDRRRFRRALARSIALHVRLWRAWPGLRRAYRAAAGGLASPESWTRRFDGR